MCSKTCIILILTLCQIKGEEHTPSTDQYLFTQLSEKINYIDLFDGPASVSQASAISAKTTQPSLDEIMYYNYFSASVYCSYQLEDLSCKYCQKFKSDISYHTGNIY